MNIERKISMMGGMGDAFLDEMSSIVFDQGLDSPASALLDDLTPIPVRISEPDLQQHCHRRHSDCAVSASSSVVNNEPLVPVTTQKKVPGKTPSSKFDFPFRLHEMLNETTTSKDEDLTHIAWMSHGTSFKILNANKFAQRTLPKFFPNSQYKSFIRQLNIYGFNRVKDRKSAAFGQYSHEHFVKGNPDLCMLMTRQKIKGTGVPRSAAKREILLSWHAAGLKLRPSAKSGIAPPASAGVEHAKKLENIHYHHPSSRAVVVPSPPPITKTFGTTLQNHGFCKHSFNDNPATAALNAIGYAHTYPSHHTNDHAFFSPQNIFGVNIADEV